MKRMVAWGYPMTFLRHCCPLDETKNPLTKFYMQRSALECHFSYTSQHVHPQKVNNKIFPPEGN